MNKTSICFLLVFFLHFGCTNYTSTPSFQAPPTLISATNHGNSNFTLSVRAQNPEIIFQGYRLFVGNSEEEARNPINVNLGAGDCALVLGAVVQPIDYLFEIDPSENTANPAAVCRFFATVSPGQFVSLRSLGLAINLQNNSSQFRVSGPSNAIPLP
ncbi:hypothetical protein P3G55_02135 [Leptospira sp. 96542]|nr:hypothetical protein [Leptospira sp. 96542]